MGFLGDRLLKFYARDDRSVVLNAVPGHFATSQSHINYYIDVTSLKSRCKEAQEAAKVLRARMLHKVHTVDTIVCMDGTEVIGAFLAKELESVDIAMTNRHETIYVVTPDVNSIGQLMFRENVRPSIEGKNVLLLLATMTTGETVKKSVECIEYYGGKMAGVASIFSTQNHIDDLGVFTLFDTEDLPGYETFSPHDCPYCKKGHQIEAMVNGFGYSKL